MSYKVNNTTVIDDSRNICVCAVNTCCVYVSQELSIPSGNSASRPTSNTVGSLYFDTDEGALVTYSGAEWTSVGGTDLTPTCLTPVTNFVGPIFICCCCCIANTTAGEDGVCSQCFFIDSKTCSVAVITSLCNLACIPTIRIYGFDPVNCTVSSCVCGELCAPYNGSKPCRLTYSSSYGMCTCEYINKSILFNGKIYTSSGSGCTYISETDLQNYCNRLVCTLYCVPAGTICGNLACTFCVAPLNTYLSYDENCLLSQSSVCITCWNGSPCCTTVQLIITICCSLCGGDCVASPRSFSVLEGYTGDPGSFSDVVGLFCNGILFGHDTGTTCKYVCYNFLCNDGTSYPLSCTWFCASSTTYPTGMNPMGFIRISDEQMVHSYTGFRCCERAFVTLFCHPKDSVCFDVTVNCDNFGCGFVSGATSCEFTGSFYGTYRCNPLPSALSESTVTGLVNNFITQSIFYRCYRENCLCSTLCSYCWVPNIIYGERTSGGVASAIKTSVCCGRVSQIYDKALPEWQTISCCLPKTTLLCCYGSVPDAFYLKSAGLGRYSSGLCGNVTSPFYLALFNDECGNYACSGTYFRVYKES